MNDITIRFLAVYEHLKNVQRIKSKYGFAKKTNISNSSLTEIFNKRTNVGIKIIQNTVINFPEINSEWLLTGKGEMLEETLNTHGNNNSQVVVNGNKIQANNIGSGSNINGDNNVVSVPNEIYGNDNEIKKELSKEMILMKSEIKSLKKQLELQNQIIELLKKQK